MELLENRDQWSTDFRAGWLKAYDESGKPDWDTYPRPRNKVVPSGRAVDLTKSRLMLISSAGGYLRESQEPFAAADVLGDYSIRTFPVATPFGELAYAHDHYDHADVDADPQTVLPLRHLETMVAEGAIGELTPSVVSFMGYQPDITRVVDEIIPQVLAIAQSEQADAALLVPV